MHREHRTQTFELALILKGCRAVIGMVLPVGLGNAELQLAGADGVDVVDRAAGRFRRTADAVLLAVLVDQTADRAAGRIIDPGNTTRAD